MSAIIPGFEKETIRNLTGPKVQLRAGAGPPAATPLANIKGGAVSGMLVSGVSSAVVTGIASAIGSAVGSAVASGAGGASASAAASVSKSAMLGAAVSVIGSGYVTFRS